MMEPKNNIAAVSEKTMSVPAGALRLADVSCRALLAGDEPGDDSSVPFTMRLYSGKVLNHWYWDQVALDLEGAVGVPETFPVLRQHDPDRILGMGHLASNDKALDVAGRIIPVNDDAREVIALDKAGYQWQASGYFVPTKIEEVKRGGTAEVNGYTVDGPATIFRQYIVREATFCALGADADTSASIAASDGKGDTVDLAVEIIGDSQVEEEDVMTVDTDVVMSFEEWKAGNADYAARLAEEAALAERARILKIQELAGNFADMDAAAGDEVKAGHTPDEAASAFTSIYGARRRQGLAEMEAETPKDLAAEEPAAPADVSTLPEAEQVKAAWDADEKLRAEFGGSFETYKAFVTHEKDGTAKILKK